MASDRDRVAISSHPPRAYKSNYNENIETVGNYIALFSLLRNPRATTAIVNCLCITPKLSRIVRLPRASRHLEIRPWHFGLLLENIEAWRSSVAIWLRWNKPCQRIWASFKWLNTWQYLAIPHRALRYLTMLYLPIPIKTLQCLPAPRNTSQYPTMPDTLPCSAAKHGTLPYLKMPHPTLPYLVSAYTVAYLARPYLAVPHGKDLVFSSCFLKDMHWSPKCKKTIRRLAMFLAPVLFSLMIIRFWGLSDKRTATQKHGRANGEQWKYQSPKFQNIDKSICCAWKTTDEDGIDSRCIRWKDFRLGTIPFGSQIRHTSTRETMKIKVWRILQKLNWYSIKPATLQRGHHVAGGSPVSLVRRPPLLFFSMNSYLWKPVNFEPVPRAHESCSKDYHHKLSTNSWLLHTFYLLTPHVFS